MSECCRVSGVECLIGLNKSRCPHHSNAAKFIEVRQYVERMKKSAEAGELLGFAADCQRLLSMLDR